MTRTVDIQTAKNQFPKLLSLALKGNEVIITEHDKPRARIVPVAAAAGMRTAGLHKGNSVRRHGALLLPRQHTHKTGVTLSCLA